MRRIGFNMDLLKAIGVGLGLWLLGWLGDCFLRLTSPPSLKREIVQLAFDLRGEPVDEATADEIAAEQFKLRPPWKL